MDRIEGGYAVTPAVHVRELLRDAEAFLYAHDPWTANTRAKQAVQVAEALGTMDADEADDLRQAVACAAARFGAAEEAAREVVKRRHVLHVSNERRAAGIPDDDVSPIVSRREERGRPPRSLTEAARQAERSPRFVVAALESQRAHGGRPST